MEMIWVWLAVVAVSLIVEFVSWDLTSIWFAVAGLISLILSAIDGICWEVQLAVFIVVSALLLIFVRKICRKLLLKNVNTKTNVDAYAGKRAKLLKAIGTDENYGEVKFNGVVWQAMSESGDEIEVGAEVEVVRVEGNKMVVKLSKPSIAVAEQSVDNEQNSQNDADTVAPAETSAFQNSEPETEINEEKTKPKSKNK